MAGLYDDAPFRRIPLDADGSVGVHQNASGNNSLTEFTPTEMANINDESQASVQIGAGPPDTFTTLIFPELRRLDGLFFASTPGFSAETCESSADTTNGVDGSWTVQIAAVPIFSSVYPYFRNNITTMAVPAAKAIRVRTDAHGGLAYIFGYHPYGAISPGETPDRILFLDTENADAVFTKPLDYAEVPRGQTQVRTIKLKNNSSSFTINTIQITAEDLYLNAGDWYTFGDDGSTYQGTFAVGNLGPSATKLIYVRQIIPDAETLGLQTARLLVSHASLS